MTEPNMIETERLLLRPYRAEDFEDVYAMHTDERILRFLGGKPLSREEGWTRFLCNIGHWAVKNYGVCAIFEKASGRFVGNTGLFHRERGLGDAFDPFPEAGWTLAHWAHGQGFASEAAQALHRWFDARVRADRTVCIIAPENSASIRVAEKLGYRPFGESTYKDDAVIMFERLAPHGG